LEIVTELAAAGMVTAGLQHVAGAVDHLAVGVELEGAVARVAGAAVGHLDLEEAVALDGQVQGCWRSG
jgi:hypothetical protein